MAKLVIFDCDGTLVDGQYRIFDAMCAAFRRVDLADPPPAMVRRVIGLSLEEAMRAVAPDQTDAARATMIEAFKGNYLTRHQAGREEPEPLYPGMRELVLSLHKAGYDLAIATGKSQRGLNRVLEAHGLTRYFASLQTADFHPSKPDPSMVYSCLTETGALGEECVMVGDTSFDMAMARAASVAAIGVSWGYHDPVDLLNSGAGSVVDTSAALADTIARIFA